MLSSSSSEDEAEDVAMETTAPPKETDKRNTRFECPEDFVSFCHVPCSSTLADNLKNDENELWLIKAPASFEPQCFSGVRVPLTGLQTVKVRTTSASGPAQQIYSVLASTRCSADLRLLTSNSQAARGFVLAPAFAGLLNICESYGDGSGSQVPHIIPAATAPSIPGLKQRFHPFGSKTPTLTCVAENEADGAAFGPSSTTLRPLVVKRFVEEGGRVDEDNDQEEEGRKRKKKKKEKRIKSEQMEVLLKVKQEPSDEFLDDGMTELPSRRGDPQAKKKKKKKRKEEEDREREEVEEGLEPSVRVKVEPVSVKCEPVDNQYGDAAESSGKKKKKKKSKTEQD